MKSPFIMHMLVALVWLFLSGNTTLGNFFLAIVLTFLLLALFQKPLHCQDYVRRMISFIRFLRLLIFEIIASNLRITCIILRPEAPDIEGDFLYYDVQGLSDLEILLISLCIGLSPGTMVADHRRDSHELIIHIFPAGSPDDVRRKLDSTLKRGILSFTR